jgi:hypothetical protein
MRKQKHNWFEDSTVATKRQNGMTHVALPLPPLVHINASSTFDNLSEKRK